MTLYHFNKLNQIKLILKFDALSMSLGLEDLTWINEIVVDLVGDMVVQQHIARTFRVDPQGMVARTYTSHELSLLLVWLVKKGVS